MEERQSFESVFPANPLQSGHSPPDHPLVGVAGTEEDPFETAREEGVFRNSWHGKSGSRCGKGRPGD